MIEVYYYCKEIDVGVKRKEFYDNKELTKFLNKILCSGIYELQDIKYVK